MTTITIYVICLNGAPVIAFPDKFIAEKELEFRNKKFGEDFILEYCPFQFENIEDTRKGDDVLENDLK